MNTTWFFATKMIFYNILHLMNEPLTFTYVSREKFSLKSDDVKRKHSNSYLNVQNFGNTIKLNAIP